MGKELQKQRRSMKQRGKQRRKQMTKQRFYLIGDSVREPKFQRLEKKRAPFGESYVVLSFPRNRSSRVEINGVPLPLFPKQTKILSDWLK